MILFIGDNNFFSFTDTVFDTTISVYNNLRQLIPNRKNQALGLMMENGDVYCRVDIDKYHISYDNIKYITYKHTLSHNYNCIKCGQKITKENIENRYFKVNKIGKSRRWN